MHSHKYFSQGNEKKTCATLKDFKKHLYCLHVIFIKKYHIHKSYDIQYHNYHTIHVINFFLKLGINLSIYSTSCVLLLGANCGDFGFESG